MKPQKEIFITILPGIKYKDLFFYPSQTYMRTLTLIQFFEIQHIERIQQIQPILGIFQIYLQ